jgi:hypothetical protein
MESRHAAALAQRTLEGLALVLLLVFCGVGVYQTATYYAPSIDSHLLTALAVFVPLGLLAFISSWMNTKSAREELAGSDSDTQRRK